MNTNNEIIVTENDLVEMMLSDIQPQMVTMTNTATVEQYTHFCNLFLFDNHIEVDTPDFGTDKYNKALAENWFMPDKYKTLDVAQWLFAKVMEEKQTVGVDFIYNSDEWIRVEQELVEFENREMIPLLQFMIYLVDFMRENGIVWGVGRGSSVASYVLYLIGIHKINSIKYNLDYKEFFR